MESDRLNYYMRVLNELAVPNNQRPLLTLDEGKEPVRSLLNVKSSDSRFGSRKMLPGNFPFNPQPQRARADKDEDRFAKELAVTEGIFT
ncbi:hypothetical protein NC651_027838 [Populus alba x Populus x berolinensis]|nr:hypothetical protein NC651_027838 [Populus alba x Populus x berolinensis]